MMVVVATSQKRQGSFQGNNQRQGSQGSFQGSSGAGGQGLPLRMGGADLTEVVSNNDDFRTGITSKKAEREPTPPVTMASPFIDKVMFVRTWMWNTTEHPMANWLAPYWFRFIMFVILFSTVTFCLETEYVSQKVTFDAMETGVVIIFTVEFVIRVLTNPNMREFVRGRMNWVDFVAIVPFYIELMKLPVEISFLRVIRLVRVLRVLKLAKGNKGVRVFSNALSKSVQPLLLLGCLMTMAMILFSSIMFTMENLGFGEPGHGFESIPHTFWWCIVTMTTVGYGDSVPRTPPGKVVAAACQCVGLLIIALPITVLGGNFAHEMGLYTATIKLVRMIDKDGSGVIDADEIEDWFELQQSGNGFNSKASNLTLQELMDVYDDDGNGYMTTDEFITMIMDTCNEIADPMKNEIHHMNLVLHDLAHSLGTPTARSKKEEVKSNHPSAILNPGTPVPCQTNPGHITDAAANVLMSGVSPEHSPAENQKMWASMAMFMERTTAQLAAIEARLDAAAPPPATAVPPSGSVEALSERLAKLEKSHNLIHRHVVALKKAAAPKPLGASKSEGS